MTNEVRLITLRHSPWSERARWALDHHHIRYREVPHEPVLGERKLRHIVGPRAGRYTVPVLLTGDGMLTESWDIARYADRVGSAEPLIDEARMKEVRDFNERVDGAMAAGRALLTSRLLADGGARDETLPRQIPRPVRVLLRRSRCLARSPVHASSTGVMSRARRGREGAGSGTASIQNPVLVFQNPEDVAHRPLQPFKTTESGWSQPRRDHGAGLLELGCWNASRMGCELALTFRRSKIYGKA